MILVASLKGGDLFWTQGFVEIMFFEAGKHQSHFLQARHLCGKKIIG